MTRPKTTFMQWRREALERYAPRGEAAATLPSSSVKGAAHGAPFGYLRVRVGQSWLGQAMMAQQRLTHKDEVRQIVAIDPTRASEPDRIHIEEPLVDYAVQKQRSTMSVRCLALPRWLGSLPASVARGADASFLWARVCLHAPRPSG